MTQAEDDQEDRIGELEDKLKAAERRIEELRQERDELRDLTERQAEHVEDCRTMIEQWKEAFNMTPDDDGIWRWDSSFAMGVEWFNKFRDLQREWNKFVPEYNAVVKPRNVGRPLNASEAQCETVLALRKRGMSLQVIADETNLGINTIRTIIHKESGTDRATRRRLERIAPDRLREAAWQSKSRTRKALPRQIHATAADGEALAKEAKGLGRTRG